VRRRVLSLSNRWDSEYGVEGEREGKEGREESRGGSREGRKVAMGLEVGR
jgi:hypothetical protein